MTEPPATAAAPAVEESAWFGLTAFMRSAGVLSMSSVANLLRAIVTAKLFAVALGPSSIGLLAQLLNFSAFAFTILPLGLTTGVTKLVAESGTDRRRTGTVVWTSSAISLISGATALVLLAPLSGRISEVLTGSSRYGFLVLLILLSFPLNNLGQVLGYVLQGLGDIRGLTVGNLLTAGTMVVAVVVGTLAFGLTGAVGSIAVASIFQAGVFVWMVALAYRHRRWSLPAWAWSRADARALLGYGGIMILAGMAMWGSVLVTRTLAIRRLGDFENGIYQVAFALSSQYMTVFMTWMAAYVFPRVTGLRTRAELDGLLNSALRANLFIMVPVLAATIALREPLIRIFYSGAFVAASPLVPIQALGDYLKILGWSFGVALFAQGHTRGYLLAIVAQAAAWVVITAATLPALGIQAVAVGYAVSWLAWPALMYPMTRAWLGVRISHEAVVLALVGAAVIAGVILIPAPWGLPLGLLVPAIVVARRRSLRFA